LPAKVHDLSVEIGRMNAPRVLQSVKGDFVAQVKVSGVTHPGAQSVIPGRKPFCSAGLLVWQDQGNYIRLERAALLNGTANSVYASWELRQFGRFVRAGNAGELPLTGADTWLRITRTGDSFVGEASNNGQDWTKLPAINLVGNTTELKVGILAVNDTPAAFTPQFSEYSLKLANKDEAAATK
jgi:regulation of enolase protein 1 (concanavalin A-like superfamily)